MTQATLATVKHDAPKAKTTSFTEKAAALWSKK